MLIALILCVIMRIAFVNAPETQPGQQPIQTNKPIRLVFVGDIMMDRGVRRSIEKNYGNDYGALFPNTTYINDPEI